MIDTLPPAGTLRALRLLSVGRVVRYRGGVWHREDMRPQISDKFNPWRDLPGYVRRAHLVALVGAGYARACGPYRSVAIGLKVPAHYKITAAGIEYLREIDDATF